MPACPTTAWLVGQPADGWQSIIVCCWPAQRATAPLPASSPPVSAAVQFISVTIRHFEEVCRQVLLDEDAMAALRRLNATLTLVDITWTCSNPVARAPRGQCLGRP